MVGRRRCCSSYKEINAARSWRRRGLQFWQKTCLTTLVCLYFYNCSSGTYSTYKYLSGTKKQQQGIIFSCSSRWTSSSFGRRNIYVNVPLLLLFLVIYRGGDDDDDAQPKCFIFIFPSLRRTRKNQRESLSLSLSLSLYLLVCVASYVSKYCGFMAAFVFFLCPVSTLPTMVDGRRRRRPKRRLLYESCVVLFHDWGGAGKVGRFSRFFFSLSLLLLLWLPVEKERVWRRHKVPWVFFIYLFILYLWDIAHRCNNMYAIIFPFFLLFIFLHSFQ